MDLYHDPKYIPLSDMKLFSKAINCLLNSLRFLLEISPSSRYDFIFDVRISEVSSSDCIALFVAEKPLKFLS